MVLIFRGVIHADADISATNDEKTRNKKVSRKVRQAAMYSEEKQKPVKNVKSKKNANQTMTNILKDTSNYIRVETPYMASQNKTNRKEKECITQKSAKAQSFGKTTKKYIPQRKRIWHR